MKPELKLSTRINKINWKLEERGKEVCGLIRDHIQRILYTCMEISLCNSVS